MPRLLGTFAFLLVGASLVSIARGAPYRIEFIAQYEGRRIEGAEVCFFKLGEGPSPVDRYLQSNDVRCLSADNVIEVPVGQWVYYMRHASGLISPAPTTMTNPAPGPPRDVFSRMTLFLVPAATIDFTRILPTLTPDDRLALYFSNAGTQMLPMLIPVAAAQRRALVPARTGVLVLKMRHSRVAGVSEGVDIEPNSSFAPQLQPDLDQTHRTIVSWIEFPKEVLKPSEFWTKLRAPTAVLTSENGHQYAPTMLPGPGFGAHGALLVFRNVPLEKATIRVAGTTWTPDELTIDGSIPGFVMSTRGLTTRPAAAVRVHWTVENAPAPSEGEDCGETSEPPQTTTQPIVLRLMACEGVTADTPLEKVALHACKVTSSPTIDNDRQIATFEGVAPGTYLLAGRNKALGFKSKLLTVSAGDDIDEVFAFRGFRVLGRVRFAGKPLRARLEFRTGAVVTDSTGEFHGFLRDSPRALPVRIRSCSDGKLIHTHLPRSPVPENEPYNIDIPQNHISIHVVDADGGSINKATVNLGAFITKNSDAGEFIGEIAPTDHDGTTVAENVPTDREFTACASHKDYERRCTDRFSVGSESTKSVTIVLPRAGSLTGRLIVREPLTWGFVYFVGPQGQILERAEIQRDATFSYNHEHYAPDYAVVVSNLALLVTSLSQPGKEGLDIEFPSAPVVDIDVQIGDKNPQQDARIGLFVGGRYVPESAYAMHQSGPGRLLQPFLYHKGPLRIPSVLMTGAPITVMLGPPPDAPPPGVPDGIDIFTLDAYSSRFPTRSVSRSARVVF